MLTFMVKRSQCFFYVIWLQMFKALIKAIGPCSGTVGPILQVVQMYSSFLPATQQILLQHMYR